MRVGFVVPAAGFVGGIERHAHDLALSLGERGHEVTLLHGPTRGRDPDVYARAFVRTLPCDEAWRVRGDLDVVWAHRANDARELSCFDPLPVFVSVHDHDLTCVRSYRYLPLGAEPCHRPPGISCVTHGCVLVRDRRPERRAPVRLRNPFALRARLRELAARYPLVANSEYIAARLVDAGVRRDRVRVVNPVPPDDAAPVTPRPAARRLLAAGQLLRGKGFDIAIDALAHLPREVTLAVVGDGPSRASLVRRAARVAPGRIDFLGGVSPERMPAQYDAASVVVVPSRWPEPFGMVGVEAMRRARPVAAAAHGGIVEWLDGAGAVGFEPGSPEALAAAARRLLDDERAGEHAHRWASERFSHVRMLDRIEQLLLSA